MADGHFEGEASAKGRLISLGEYPALLDGAGTVRGELYIFDDLPAALDALDDVENFDPSNPEGSEYIRQVRIVTRDDGPQIPAWVYVYNRSVGTAQVIKSGDWHGEL